MLKNYLVADVGGTCIRVACFPVGQRTLSVLQRIDTVGPDTPLERLIHLLADVASKGGEINFSPRRDAINTHVMSKKYLENLCLTGSALGDEAGLMGALALAQDLTPATP